MDSKSVYERACDKEYENKVEYPSQNPRPRVPGPGHTVAEMMEYCNQLNRWNKEQEAYKAKREAYNAETNRQLERFEADLAKEHGVETHPKRGALWSKAWERGHSAGLTEVALDYEDLVELLQ